MFLHSGCDFGDTYTRCSFFSLSNINHESFQGCARPGILPESQHPAKWAILFSPFLFFFISSPRNLFLPEMDPVSLLSIVFYRTFLNLLRGMDTFIFWEQKNLRIRRNKTWMWSDIYLFGSGGKIFFNAFRSFEKFGKVIIINIYDEILSEELIYPSKTCHQVSNHVGRIIIVDRQGTMYEDKANVSKICYKLGFFFNVEFDRDYEGVYRVWKDGRLWCVHCWPIRRGIGWEEAHCASLVPWNASFVPDSALLSR